MATDPDRQLPGGPGSVNEQFFDALIRHQIGLMRLSGSVRNDVLRLLDETEEDIADKIRSRLRKRGGEPGLQAPSDVRRLQRLLRAIRAPRAERWDDITEVWVQSMLDLAAVEAEANDRALKTVAPAVLATTLPSPEVLRQIVTTRPFEGKTLREWARNIKRADLTRIENQVRIGLVQGEGSDAIARRVVGTVRRRGRDGQTEVTRRQAAAITRTAVNHVANQVRREFAIANKDLFTGEVYTAVLDARTTPICRSLDGNVYPVGEGPIPPLHFNCRSTRTLVIDGEVIGRRPTREFTEGRLVREFVRQEDLPRTIRRRADLPRGTRMAYDQFSRRRMRELTGTVPAKVTYQQWLGRQSAAFQDDVLGQTRGRLFRRGGLTLDKFVNRAGDEIPLSELARRDADAFRAAGLDPEDFR